MSNTATLTATRPTFKAAKPRDINEAFQMAAMAEKAQAILESNAGPMNFHGVGYQIRYFADSTVNPGIRPCTYHVAKYDFRPDTDAEEMSTHYFVSLSSGKLPGINQVGCDCPCYKNRGNCKHFMAVKMHHAALEAERNRQMLLEFAETLNAENSQYGCDPFAEF